MHGRLLQVMLNKDQTEEIIDLLGAEERSRQRITALLANNRLAFDYLLKNNAGVKARQQKMLSDCQSIDRQFSQQLSYQTAGLLQMTFEEQAMRYFKRQVADLADDDLNNLMRQFMPLSLVHLTDGDRWISKVTIPTSFKQLVVLDSDLSFWVEFQLNLPKQLAKQFSGNSQVNVPVKWHADDRLPIDQITNWYGNVKVKVLSGFDGSADYYWDQASGLRDYQMAQRIVNKINAYASYKLAYANLSWFEKWFTSELSMKDWEQQTKSQQVDLKRNYCRVNDPKVVDVLAHSSGFQKDFKRKALPLVDEWQRAFQLVWHDVLNYPEIQFHQANIEY